MRAGNKFKKYILSPVLFRMVSETERDEEDRERERERMKKFCVVDSFTNDLRLLAPRISQCSMPGKLTFLNHLLSAPTSQLRWRLACSLCIIVRIRTIQTN
jgi:hypothetical protein